MNNQTKPVWDLSKLLDEVQDMIEERNAIYYLTYKEETK